MNLFWATKKRHIFVYKNFLTDKDQSFGSKNNLEQSLELEADVLNTSSVTRI